MIKAAVMIIWFGSGQYAQFDTDRYNSLAECEAARVAVLEHANSEWGFAPQADDIVCKEIEVWLQ